MDKTRFDSEDGKVQLLPCLIVQSPPPPHLPLTTQSNQEINQCPQTQDIRGTGDQQEVKPGLDKVKGPRSTFDVGQVSV